MKAYIVVSANNGSSWPYTFSCIIGACVITRETVSIATLKSREAFGVAYTRRRRGFLRDWAGEAECGQGSEKVYLIVFH